MANIMQVDLNDSSASQIINSGYTNIDGIDMDCQGNFYISTWGTQAVHVYNNDFSSIPVGIVSGLNNPADIHYNRVSDTLAIPSSFGNFLTFFEMPDTICNPPSPTSVESLNNLIGLSSLYMKVF